MRISTDKFLSYAISFILMFILIKGVWLHLNWGALLSSQSWLDWQANGSVIVITLVLLVSFYQNKEHRSRDDAEQ